MTVKEEEQEDKPIKITKSDKVFSIENLSDENLRSLPTLDRLRDDISDVAAYFLSQFSTTKRIKNTDNTYTLKKTHWYASVIRMLRIKEIKILTIDYEHFTSFVDDYHAKVYQIVSAHQFTYPNIRVSELDEYELFDLEVYMFAKKLLQYLEGEKVNLFMENIKKGAFKVLEALGIDIQNDDQERSLYNDTQISIVNFPIEKPIHEINSKLVGRACVVKGNLVSYDSQRRIEVITSWWGCNSCGYIFSMSGKTKPIKCRNCNEKAGFEPMFERNENKDYILIKVQQRLNSEESQVGVTDLLVKIEGNHLISQFFKKMKPAANLKITGIVDLYEDRSNRNRDEMLLQQKALTVEVENENSQVSYNERLLDIIATQLDYDHIEEHIDKLVRSMAPQLHGLEMVKLAVLLQCVDAEPRVHGDAKARIRGNINLMLVGDPGMGKSEFGHYVLKISPQSIRTVGGSSTTTKAALTTSVDIINGVRVVTFGVLALCDKRGTAVIDELDKRSKEDFEILSIPMDDAQCIPTHKSGFHQDVMARCPVLLIGNPTKNNGKWDPSKRIDEQTNFASWLTSRVDLIFVITDDNDMKRKAEMLEHISRTRNRMVIEDEYDKDNKNKAYSDLSIEKVETDLKSNNFSGIYDAEYIRHEIHYLKEHYRPVIKPGSSAEKKLHKKWLELSNISMPSIVGEDDNRPNPLMDTRKINSLERLAMAAARLRRHHTVLDEDIDTAIDLMTFSIATLLPRKIDDDKLQREDPFSQMVKIMNSKEADKIVNSINKDYIEMQKKIASGYRTMLTNFNKILFHRGFIPCASCRGRGYIDNETCVVCKGNKVERISFTRNDLEADVMEANKRTKKIIMSHVDFERWFQQYFKKGIIVAERGHDIYRLGIKRVDDVDVTNFVEAVSEMLANSEVQKIRAQTMGGVAPISYEGIKPTRVME